MVWFLKKKKTFFFVVNEGIWFLELNPLGWYNNVTDIRIS